MQQIFMTCDKKKNNKTKGLRKKTKGSYWHILKVKIFWSRDMGIVVYKFCVFWNYCLGHFEKPSRNILEHLVYFFSNCNVIFKSGKVTSVNWSNKKVPKAYQGYWNEKRFKIRISDLKSNCFKSLIAKKEDRRNSHLKIEYKYHL